MNKETADKNGIHLGDVVTLDAGAIGKTDWQVIGLYRVIYGGAGFINDFIYAPRDAVLSATQNHNRATTVYARLRMHDESFVNATTAQLKDMFESRNLKLANTLTEIKYKRRGDGMFGITIAMLLALAVIVALVGGIALMGTLSISVVERTKEIGVLRAVGARSRTVMSMFVMEGNLQGILSWIIAVMVSLIFSQPMSDVLGRVMLNMPLSYQVNYAAILIWLMLIVVISTLASIIPAHSASRMSVRETLAYA